MRKIILYCIVFLFLVANAIAIYKNITLSYDPIFLNMTTGCDGEIAFKPKTDYEFQVCANDGTIDYGCVIYSSEEYNKTFNISTIDFIGDTLLIKNYDRRELKEGQIVCYKTNSLSVCHRIIGIAGDTLVVQGDNNRLYEVIDKNDVIGLCVGVLYT